MQYIWMQRAQWWQSQAVLFTQIFWNDRNMDPCVGNIGKTSAHSCIGGWVCAKHYREIWYTSLYIYAGSKNYCGLEERRMLSQTKISYALLFHLHVELKVSSLSVGSQRLKFLVSRNFSGPTIFHGLPYKALCIILLKFFGLFALFISKPALSTNGEIINYRFNL